MAVTPTVIQRLREVLGNERMKCIGMQPFEFYQQAQGLTYDAIAAVEQELAAKDAEIAELRKRPRLDEVLSYLPSVFAREPALLEQIGVEMRALYAEKARAEAPK